MPCPNVWLKKEKSGLMNVVPCGYCTSCRIAKMQEWKLRMLMESEYHNDACFVTLTYNEDSISRLPRSKLEIMSSNGIYPRFSLDFEHLALFFKRLRKDIDQPIKYYACGEYGDKFKRPHFHAIIYGLGVNENTRRLLKDNWRYCDEDRFNGVRSGLAFADPDSMLYVSSYVRKKLVGRMAKENYYDVGLEPPDSRCSQGIGYQWYEDNRDKVLRDLCITYQGKKYPIPRYFLQKDPELMYEVNHKLLEHEKESVLRYRPGDTFDYYKDFRKVVSRYKTLTETEYRVSSERFNANIDDRLKLFQRQIRCEDLL